MAELKVFQAVWNVENLPAEIYARFKYMKRVTMMETVCADGTFFSPLFVINGKDIP